MYLLAFSIVLVDPELLSVPMVTPLLMFSSYLIGSVA